MLKSTIPAFASITLEESPSFSPPVAVELLAGLGRHIGLLFSTEFNGLYKNGGIGTFYRQIARALREKGWFVVLINLGPLAQPVEPATIDLDAVLHARNFPDHIEPDPVTHSLLEGVRHDLWATVSLQCLAYTRAAIRLFQGQKVYAEFHEMCGIGYDTAKASEAGLLGPDCVVGVTMHSGHEWIYEANQAITTQPNGYFLNVCNLEEHSFASADLAMFPSDSLHAIVESLGWRLDRARKLPYLVPVA
jgi:hypothetical protein